MIKTSELKSREVINIMDGKRLGVINDIEIDLATGSVLSISIPGGNRILGMFGKCEDVVIPWDKIKKIGVDVILVEGPNYGSEIKKLDNKKIE